MEEFNIDAAVVAVWAAELPSSERRYYQNLLLDNNFTPLDFLTKTELVDNLPRLSKKLSSRSDFIEMRDNLRKWQEQGISCLYLGYEKYPQKLAFIQDPPPVLFYRGSWLESINEREILAIVGSRRADLQVCQLAYNLAKGAAELGTCVVSGLAYGVDARAHHGALDSETIASTIAVLGGGLEKIYPAAHLPLAKRIIENGGMLLSQFIPSASPLPANFLNRNRIIAGLSDGVLVIQAGEKSGSLSTARWALEGGKDVLVCPGSYGDERFKGSNQLIKHGAYLVNSFEDVLDFLPQAKEAKSKKEASSENEDKKLSPLSCKILKLLKTGPVDFEDVVEKFSSEPNIRSELFDLELNGMIVCMPDNTLVRNIP